MFKARTEMRILNILMYGVIGATVACCAAAPWLLGVFGYETEYIVPLWAIGAAAITAVWALRGILKQVSSGDPFSRRNVAYLQRISYCCFAVSLAALGMIPIYYSLIKVLLAFFAAVGGLIMRVLAYVFLLAAEQKEELDLII